MVTYDSGADGHYINEQDRATAQLPILGQSTKVVGVANGGTSQAEHVTAVPFHGFSHKAIEADTFEEFPQSLLSVGKLADEKTISIFTHDGVAVHKEEDVLITCKGQPVLIGVRDNNSCYRIPLIQSRGQWQPRQPSKQAKEVLHQANNVYDLPPTEQAIRWMHAVCGYLVKSTWLKAVKAGNFVCWPMLTEQNINKYYPDTAETQKGHMNQTRKNLWSTETPSPIEVANTQQLRGKKLQDVYIKVYDVRETVFTNQTGKFPTTSQSGNKYIMVMVGIDSSGILVERLKSRHDSELTRACKVLIQWLRQACIQPKKHALDNKISTAMKHLITDKYKMKYELVPPGCHQCNDVEVAIRNVKAHFLGILVGVSDHFPLRLWDKLLPQAEITINLLRQSNATHFPLRLWDKLLLQAEITINLLWQSNATPTVSVYLHMNRPFDSNKISLAPMGCDVRVHKKSNKRGTWAFYSVD
jgi:hypothetical protein